VIDNKEEFSHMTYKLMIKTHNDTGLKYLCVTSKEDYELYKGSGVYWKNHIKAHGDNISTELLIETDDLDELTQMGLKYSATYDVVESSEWANLIPESGYHVLYPEKQRNGWLGWYNSLTEDERLARNANISQKVKERLCLISDELPDILRERRLSLSDDKRTIRKEKIQEVYATGKHDKLFERYSKERIGRDNPAAKSITVDGVEYGSVQEASRATGIPPHTLYRVRRKQEVAQ